MAREVPRKRLGSVRETILDLGVVVELREQRAQLRVGDLREGLVQALLHGLLAAAEARGAGARDRRDPRLLLRGGQLLVERRRASVADLRRLERAWGRGRL